MGVTFYSTCNKENEIVTLYARRGSNTVCSRISVTDEGLHYKVEYHQYGIIHANNLSSCDATRCYLSIETAVQKETSKLYIINDYWALIISILTVMFAWFALVLMYKGVLDFIKVER